MTAICEAVGVARSNIAARTAGRPQRRRGRPPQPEDALLARIKSIIAEMPTYGYARVWAVLRREARRRGWSPSTASASIAS